MKQFYICIQVLIAKKLFNIITTKKNKGIKRKKLCKQLNNKFKFLHHFILKSPFCQIKNKIEKIKKMIKTYYCSELTNLNLRETKLCLINNGILLKSSGLKDVN